MSLLSQVTTGIVKQPHLILVFGPSGVGKTTLGADAPKAVFISGENGTSHLDVARFPQPKSFADVMQAIRELTTEAHDFKTLVVDSLDWIEPLVFQSVCAKAKVENIEDIGFGKGYVHAMDLWGEFIQALTDLRQKRGMNVILIAHAQIKTQYDAKEQKEYQRYMLKLNEKASAKFREFVDSILFATYEVITTTDQKTGKTKAFGGDKRVMYTEWRTTHDAKNRHGLPYQLPLSYEAYDEAVKSAQPEDPVALRRTIEAMIKGQPETFKTKVVEKLKTAQTSAELMRLKSKVETSISAQA
jgi:hypothetical protein